MRVFAFLIFLTLLPAAHGKNATRCEPDALVPAELKKTACVLQSRLPAQQPLVFNVYFQGEDNEERDTLKAEPLDQKKAEAIYEKYRVLLSKKLTSLGCRKVKPGEGTPAFEADNFELSFSSSNCKPAPLIQSTYECGKGERMESVDPIHAGKSYWIDRDFVCITK